MTAESFGELSRPKKLNKREREILRLMADAHSPNEIAVELVIAVETVDWYRRQILKKLEAKDALQAMAIAQEMGLIEAAIHTEDETLPARPDEVVSPVAEVKTFFENLPEAVMETPLMDETLPVTTDSDAETLPERPADWPPVAEWAVAEFEPQRFEYENIPDPFLVLKDEEVVSDPLPFEVVLDDLTPSVTGDAPLETIPINAAAFEVDNSVSSLLYADDIQVGSRPELSESELVSLEQPSGVYESFLGFDEIETGVATPAEPEFPLPESDAIVDVSTDSSHAGELQAEQSLPSDSELVSLEQPVDHYESFLGFEELETTTTTSVAEVSPSAQDMAEMPQLEELLAQFDPPPAVEASIEASQPEAPSRKRRRKRKRKSKQAQPEIVDQTVPEVENAVSDEEVEARSFSDAVVTLHEQPLAVNELPVELPAAEAVLDDQTVDEVKQPVTAVFELEPVYGFDEPVLEADPSFMPEFTLYTSDQVLEAIEAEPILTPDSAPQAEAEWTTFDEPVEPEAVQNVVPQPIVPEPEYVPPHNLPAPTGFLVGRRREITEIKHLLGSLRWLTLTGPGGVGKTRLALEIARELQGEFPDGVGYVSLAAVNDSALVQDVILRTLGITRLKGKTIKDTLQQVFGQRSLLLILDQMDSARHDASPILDLLAGIDITIIATARKKLAFAQEIEFPVSPLDFPEVKPRKRYKLADLEKADSIAFLIQQMQAVVAGYRPNDEEATLLAQICARLRGLPLALEWVAARSTHYPPQMILMQLDNRLRALGSDPKTPASPQQALQSALSWSHNLLNREEQLLFAGLGLFGGSWTVESAEAVFRSLMTMPVAQAVESLVEKHFVREQASDNHRPRFTLDQAVRDYALEKLKNHDRMTWIREAFAAHYVDLAEYAASELDGAERILWLKRLEAEHDNFRYVLNWSLEYRHFETLVRLTNALWSFWEVTGRFAEGHHWLEHSLAQNTGANAQAQTKLRQAAGVLAFQTGNYAQARGMLEECLVLHRFSGDRQAEAQILALLSDVAVAEGDEARAADLLASSLSLGRRLNHNGMVFDALERLTTLATRRNDVNLLRAPLAETLEYFYQNEDLSNLTRCLLFPASLAAGLWQCDRAVRLYAVCSALMDATGLMLPVGESTRYDAALSEMRRFMGPEAFESAWETGFAFTVEQAMAFALEYTQGS